MTKKSNKLFFILMLVAMSWCASVQADFNREYQLKAAYLLNFARFIYWPDQALDSSDDFYICVVGKNPFGDNLEKLSNKKIKNKNIKVTYLKSLNEDNQCHIVYLSKDKKDTYKEIIKALSGKAILTVSDIEGFTNSGGMIGFVRVKNKIKFEINVEKSFSCNIKYRSQLLEVAEKLR